MSKKRKKRGKDTKRALTKLVLATTILNLLTAALELLKTLLN